MLRMSVKDMYYNMLKSGLKTIELRLFDEKRKQIEVGDIIEFYNSSNANDHFPTKVIYLYRAANFEELCQKIKARQAGFDSNEDLMKTMEEYYPLEQQNETGVVGLEIVKV